MTSPMIGCAGWSIPRQEQVSFPPDGSHLERYAQRLPAVEINSSFYRPHRRATYERWAASVPAGFQFSVKVPKAITHDAKLVNTGALLDTFLEETGGLGKKLGVLLVQLPPGLRFDPAVARRFLASLRKRHAGVVACEPRHPGWFEAEAGALLCEMKVARVAADPPPVPGAALPGGWDGTVYYRLHGFPKMYYSAYTTEFLAALADRIAGKGSWCIFDNTAVGAATANALDLLGRLSTSDQK